jgi:hypothetical protein
MGGMEQVALIGLAIVAAIWVVAVEIRLEIALQHREDLSKRIDTLVRRPPSAGAESKLEEALKSTALYDACRAATRRHA